MTFEPNERIYLGDGVYATFDGFQIWLNTQTGDHIALEPSVFKSLIDYQKQIYKFYELPNPIFGEETK